MAKRRMRTSKLMTIKVIPTADIICAREGGSTEFGEPPLGFEAMKIFERSKLESVSSNQDWTLTKATFQKQGIL